MLKYHIVGDHMSRIINWITLLNGVNINVSCVQQNLHVFSHKYANLQLFQIHNYDKKSISCTFTVLPAESDSDVMFCLQLLSKE